MTGRRRRSRLLLALAVVAIVEASLQLAGPVVQRAMRRQDESPSADTGLTVLCVGDSNTYGLHLPRVYAYPALLEALLSARYRRPVSVVNRGVPGQNTAQVAHGLMQDLADVRPDIVLVLAGINDTWNTDREGGGPVAWLGRLKLVRLMRVLSAGITSSGHFEIDTDAEGEIVIDRGEGRQRVNAGTEASYSRGGDALAAALRSGLRRAVETCQDFGATPVLMTYAEYQGSFAEVNATVRALARAEHVLLVDHEGAFQAHFAERGYDTLMFTDHHPNQAGYQLMAAAISDAFVAADLVPELILTHGPGEDLVSSPPSLPRVVEIRPDRVVFEGPPGWAWQALVSEGPRSGDDGFDIGGTRVPLRPSGLLALSRHEPTFSGRFGTEAVSLRIPPALRRGATAPMALCVLLLRDAPRGGAESTAPAIAAVAGPFLLDD